MVEGKNHPVLGARDNCANSNQNHCYIPSLNPGNLDRDRRLDATFGLVRSWEMMIQLGDKLVDRCELISDPKAINNAIQYHYFALSLIPNIYGDRTTLLINLGDLYMAKFRHCGIPADIDKAIDFQSRAILLIPPGYANLVWFGRLGSSYIRRFERYAKLPDLDKGIQYLTRAVVSAPKSDTNNLISVSNLGLAYRERFELLGELPDIASSIRWLSSVVLEAPDEQEYKPTLLTNLGGSYARRYEQLRELGDINKAIECHSRAFQLTPVGSPFRPQYLNNIAMTYMCRYDFLRESSDVEQAVDYLNQAARLVPDDHSFKPNLLHNLGASYLHRYDLHKESSDLTAAIDCWTKALRLTPGDHPLKYRELSSLGRLYKRRFEHYGDSTDIDRAIEYQSQAIPVVRDGFVDQMHVLNNLAISYLCRYKHLGGVSDLEASNASFQQVAHFAVGPAAIRFGAALEWARTCIMLNNSARLAYQKAMELVQKVAWQGITIKDRYSLVKDIGNVAMQAATYAIVTKEYDRALEWLEEGRSVVWGQILRLDTPFDDISNVDPELGERLKQVALELQQANSRSEAAKEYVLDLDGDNQNRHRLAIEWDQLLERARQLPGFNNLMKPPKVDALLSATKDGPIVVINSQQVSCDALIIQPNSNEISHVPLEGFSQEKAVNARAKLDILVGHRNGRAGGFKRLQPEPKPEELLKQMLRDLWTDVVKPVLDFLGYTRERPVDDLPHVTWCTTGALSFIPLHAAGCYDGSQPNTFDLIVSSYTPTLSALLSKSPTGANSSSGILAVGLEHAKGLAHLPNVVHELAAVREHATATEYIQLEGSSATVDAVLDAMDQYDWVHLACHASQNAAEPTHSAFHLHDGDLTLSAIAGRSFRNKGLAFLSACQTATGDERFPDEAVHLAAGMLKAGYPSVIATMWAIQDEDAPDVARDLYAYLLKDGRMDHTKASRALHKAVAGLRQKVGEDAFEQWVPFVHFGS